MESTNQILQEINVITLEIESDYPEIYKFLDEDFLTLPSWEHPNINFEILKEYLDTLSQLLKGYRKTHFINAVA